MSDVPSDLVREILLRLPAESLLRFRAVSKHWLLTIDDPSFIKSHSLNTNHSTLLLRDSIFCRLYSLSLLSLNPTTQTLDLSRIKTLVRAGVPFLRDLPATSCNGLILISHYNFFKSWVIWNPLTQEFLRLSDPGDLDLGLAAPSAGVGLGYDGAADDYKVVKIDNWPWNDVFETLIYSLRSDSWRVARNCPCDSSFLRSGAAYHDGGLYWVTKNEVVALDMGSEEYRLMPLPPLFTELGEPLDMYVDAMDGCLLLSCYYTSAGLWTDGFGVEERLEGWIIDGGDGAWDKCFSFGERGSAAVMREARPVAYVKSRGEVFVQNGGWFYWLDVGKNSIKKVTVDGLPECFSCQSFRGSLVRLVGEDEGRAGGRAAGGSRRKMRRARSR